ncbi:Response regulator receiver domain [Magnetospirillum sp. LM-5]|uniref:response regulator n=1 Tax=Magnetospirillum sp. LM-5 TaxID=2681466 RepID=UPI00137DC3EF|nr:response regulator [Magnetospirillum sp. LM-5]CAA7622086.1 Response regulator receiver domain [Magnetospirillum sp. LM-5]
MAKIVVIDDEEMVLLTIREILRRAGHEVFEAKDGVAGLELQRQVAAPLVITDIIMPRMEGLEAISELRREFPDTRVIAISGGGRTRNLDFLNMAGTFGADRMLPKPFTPADLMAAVNACLATAPNPATP